VNKVYLLDACALLALFKGEEGAAVVAQAYKEAKSGQAQLLMNRVNLYEVYYDAIRDKGIDYAEMLARSVEESVVSICEFDRAVFTKAGPIKATYKVSLADSIALAQAMVLDANFLTSDHHEFDVIEGKEPIRFQWIR